MKSIFVATIVVGMMSASCTREQISVRANNDFHIENTENQTFTIVQSASEQASPLNETVIKEEIEKQMEIRGYSEKNANADVLISIAVYDKDIRLTEVKKMNVGTFPEEERIDIHRKSLNDGALVITMIDRNSNKAFWTGHASKIFGKHKSLKDRDLKNITRAIFDNYRITASHFLAIN